MKLLEPISDGHETLNTNPEAEGATSRERERERDKAVEPWGETVDLAEASMGQLSKRCMFGADGTTRAIPGSGILPS